ncbi:hypothetical protein HPB50_027210 [Hyalomma asiaticum]|uniref:Uncharacterized protein n=1 Tax=Hyalomma asiaticum TaxID=266040 RepID=A0ACB7SJ82_HYAAI|nr:hypothetical protein HPB50_027210 [Hyalomma asiaticum]
MESPRREGAQRPSRRQSPRSKKSRTPTPVASGRTTPHASRKSQPSTPSSPRLAANGNRHSPSPSPFSTLLQSGTRSPGAASGTKSPGTYLGYYRCGRSKRNSHGTFVHSGDTQGPPCGQRATMVTLSLFSVLVIVVIVTTLTLALYFGKGHYLPERQPRFQSPSVMGVYRNWVVVSSAQQCNHVTRDILVKNGTVGDAAVATMLCICAVMPHRCGLGGGFAATYYNRKTRNATAVLATPRAPAASSLGMFLDNVNASYVGARAVATFGELKGYELLLNVTGSRIPWRELFEEAITTAKRGVSVYDELAQVIATVTDDPDFTARKSVTDPLTTRPLKSGDVYKNVELAETLRQIADSPLRGHFFHSGAMMETIVQELKIRGGILTTRDLNSFKADATPAIAMALSSGLRLLTTPPPTSGAVLAFVMSIMDKLQSGGRLPDDHSSAHYIVEALKFGFARRSRLGDPEEPEIRESVTRFLKELLNRNVSDSVAREWLRQLPNPDASYYGLEPSSSVDQGSGQMCVIGLDGDALCLISSLNAPFGARLRSEASGIWYNSYMSAFASPYEQSAKGEFSNENNYIRPGVRPLTSFCPTLIVNATGDVVYAASATGGQTIISGLAQVLVRCLWMEHNVKQGIDAGRLHNQLHPDNIVYYENTTDKDVVAQLEWRGHVLAPFTWPGAVIAVRRRSEGIYEACHDYRIGNTASSDGGELFQNPRVPA